MASDCVSQLWTGHFHFRPLSFPFVLFCFCLHAKSVCWLPRSEICIRKSRWSLSEEQDLVSLVCFSPPTWSKGVRGEMRPVLQMPAFRTAAEVWSPSRPLLDMSSHLCCMQRCAEEGRGVWQCFYLPGPEGQCLLGHKDELPPLRSCIPVLWQVPHHWQVVTFADSGRTEEKCSSILCLPGNPQSQRTLLWFYVHKAIIKEEKREVV